MKSHTLLLAAALVLAAALSNPAEGAQRQRWPDRGNGGQQQGGGNGGGGNGGGGQAQPRGAQPRGDGGGRARSGDGGGRREAAAPPAARESAPPPSRTDAGERERSGATARRRDDADRRRIDNDGDRGERTANGGNRGVVVDRGVNAERGGDNNRRAIGDRDGRSRVGSSARVAIPRQGRPPSRVRRDDRDWRGRNIYIVPRGRTYSYYPRYYYNPYSYGYGPWGRGHFYFDLHYNSYIWHPVDVYRYGNYGSYGYPTGELRIDVEPKQAQVFVDGYYAGVVDDFDGIFQSLRLEDGEYQVEIVQPGFEPLAFDVRILPGEKVTYRGFLEPERP
jgi:hypothetical protein